MELAQPMFALERDLGFTTPPHPHSHSMSEPQVSDLYLEPHGDVTMYSPTSVSAPAATSGNLWDEFP